MRRSTGHTDEVDDAVGDAQRARRLDTAADILDLGLQLGLDDVAVDSGASLGRHALELGKVALGEPRKGRDDALADQLLGLLDVAVLRHLDLQLARAERQVEHLLHAAGLGASAGRQVLLGRGGLVLGDLVAAGNAEVDAALADEGRNVGGGQEDERDGQVLDQGDVEARVAVELDVAAGEEVESGFVEAALFGDGEEQPVCQVVDEIHGCLLMWLWRGSD